MIDMVLGTDMKQHCHIISRFQTVLQVKLHSRMMTTGSSPASGGANGPEIKFEDPADRAMLLQVGVWLSAGLAVLHKIDGCCLQTICRLCCSRSAFASLQADPCCLDCQKQTTAGLHDTDSCCCFQSICCLCGLLLAAICCLCCQRKSTCRMCLAVMGLQLLLCLQALAACAAISRLVLSFSNLNVVAAAGLHLLLCLHAPAIFTLVVAVRTTMRGTSQICFELSW